MEPIAIPTGCHAYLSALDAVAYYVGDPRYMVWHDNSEVIDAALYPPDMFTLYLADGRTEFVEQQWRLCVWRRSFCGSGICKL
jgi:hypothetical protein